MTVWSPISGEVVQYYNPSTNVPYSGAVLKPYRAGTSTNINFATDNTGGTTISSVALNAYGFPESSGTIIVPHVSENYKLSLYPTQAAADSDTGEIWSIDNLKVTHNTSFEYIKIIPSDSATSPSLEIDTTNSSNPPDSNGDGESAIHMYGTGVQNFLLIEPNGEGADSGAEIWIDSEGSIVFGAETFEQVTNNPNAFPRIQQRGRGSAETSGFLQAHSENDTSAPTHWFVKSRGTNPLSRAIVQIGDTLGGIAFNGDDGVDIQTIGARILAQVVDTPSANTIPTNFLFQTTNSGGNLATRLTVDENGISTDGGQFVDEVVVTRGSAGSAITCLSIVNSAGTTAGTAASLRFSPTSATYSTRFVSIDGYNEGSDDMSLVFNTGNAGVPSAKMRLKSDGAFQLRADITSVSDPASNWVSFYWNETNDRLYVRKNGGALQYAQFVT